MTTQKDLATAWGLDSDRSVRKILDKLNVSLNTHSAEIITRMYIEHLRKQAAGHEDSEGNSLVREKAENLKLDRQIKELNLAQLKKQLIDVNELLPELQGVFIHIRSHLHKMPNKVVNIINARYGVKVDKKIILNEVNDSLSELCRYTENK